MPWVSAMFYHVRALNLNLKYGICRLYLETSGKLIIMKYSSSVNLGKATLEKCGMVSKLKKYVLVLIFLSVWFLSNLIICYQVNGTIILRWLWKRCVQVLCLPQHSSKRQQLWKSFAMIVWLLYMLFALRKNLSILYKNTWTVVACLNFSGMEKAKIFNLEICCT